MKAHHNISELLKEGKKILKENGVEEFSIDAQSFMMEATGLSKVKLYTMYEYILKEEEKEKFFSMINERIKKVPTQYILGRGSFMDFEFKVTPSVLIPRQDTEILVETVLEYSKNMDINKVVDVGCGSGCIAISLKKYGINFVSAIDISPEALKIARENAESNNADITFIQSDLFKEVPESNKFDAIVSNPPYIVRSVINELMEEVRLNEPTLALDGGEDGLDFYREIICQGKNRLREEGWMFFEIGYDQGESVSDLLTNNKFTNVKVIKDLSGRDRVVVGRKSGEI